MVDHAQQQDLLRWKPVEDRLLSYADFYGQRIERCCIYPPISKGCERRVEDAVSGAPVVGHRDGHDVSFGDRPLGEDLARMG